MKVFTISSEESHKARVYRRNKLKCLRRETTTIKLLIATKMWFCVFYVHRHLQVCFQCYILLAWSKKCLEKKFFMYLKLYVMTFSKLCLSTSR